MGGSSGGGGGAQQVTQTTSNLPDYARPYFENLLDRTNSVSQEGYIPYTGQRTADTSAATVAGQQAAMTAGQNTTPLLNQSVQNLGLAGNVAGTNANFQAGQITSNYRPQTYQAGQIQAGQVQAQGVGTQGFNQAAADAYMSPYQQSVTNVQKDAAVLDYQRGAASRDDSAIRAGAFGGSRQAIQQGLAQQGLATQLGAIQAQGSQNAFGAAQQQFNADQARGLQAQTSNQSAGLQAQQANQQAGLTAQQASEASRQYAANFGNQSAQYANTSQMTAQQQSEAARQQAAGIQMAGGNLALQNANAYGSLATTAQGLNLQQAQAMQGVGAQQQATQQAQLDMAYQDFVNQRDYPRQQLNFYSGILRGTPVSANSETVQQSTANPTSQAIGLGIAGLGAYRALS